MGFQGKDWKSYDGRELVDGYVLVPQVVSPEYARSIGAVMGNLRTWTLAGVRYTVMFVHVPEEKKRICMKSFYSQVNDLLDEKLGPGRRGRCVVSLDALLEEDYLPADASPSAESIVMEGILLDEMIADLGRKNPLFGDIIRLGYRGFGRKDIVDALPVGKSQAYDMIRKCREEAERWVR